MKVRFLYFTWNGKASTSVGSDKLYACIIIPRATTKESIQRNTLKNVIT